VLCDCKGCDTGAVSLW